jgi:hypothetical protein
LHAACPHTRAARQHDSSADADRQHGVVAAVFAVAVAALSTTANGVTAAGLPYLVAVAIALAAAFHITRYFATPERSQAGRSGYRVRGHALYLALAVVGVVVALSPAAVASARCRPPVAPKVSGPGQVVRFDAGRPVVEFPGHPTPRVGQVSCRSVVHRHAASMHSGPSRFGELTAGPTAGIAIRSAGYGASSAFSRVSGVSGSSHSA